MGPCVPSKGKQIDRFHLFTIDSFLQHSQDEKLQQYLQDGLCKLRLQKSTVFDVQSLLLRPIQRIVRYPLIFNELFKVNHSMRQRIIEELKMKFCSEHRTRSSRLFSIERSD